MEKNQRQTAKMIPELRNFSYERSLQQLELISLEQKRLRGQLIEAVLSASSQALNFFPVKIAETWNQLPENIVPAGSLCMLHTLQLCMLHTLQLYMLHTLQLCMLHTLQLCMLHTLQLCMRQTEAVLLPCS
ncbi:hypothetical protein FHG87_019838 [Trinorchestia longiramus]|nr:hypothetical protein FHG87_019838 [Trinorchestia longiramus]